MSVITIVQARMASDRLPGKTMADLAGKPVLEHVLDRVRAADIGQIIVATTTDEADDAIADVARDAGVYCHRGHPTDVLERFYVTHGMLAPDADAIVRVTADCPLLDIRLLRLVARKIAAGGYDYIGVHGAPNGYHQEAFTARALALTHRLAVSQYDREHVVTYMLDRPALFRIGWVQTAIDGDPVTLDTQADLDRLRGIVAT